jgi:hypothetical protein
MTKTISKIVPAIAASLLGNFLFLDRGANLFFMFILILSPKMGHQTDLSYPTSKKGLSGHQNLSRSLQQVPIPLIFLRRLEVLGRNFCDIYQKAIST